MHSSPAYYNAGSTAIFVVIIFVAIGIFIWWRKRKARAQTLHLPLNHTDEEESIPLTQRERSSLQDFRPRKGKERAVDSQDPPIFDVGDDDDEEDERKYHDRDRGD